MYKSSLTTRVWYVCCFKQFFLDLNYLRKRYFNENTFKPVDDVPFFKSKSKLCQGHTTINLFPNSSISPCSNGPPSCEHRESIA